MDVDQYSVHVLREGYSTAMDKGRSRANGTITLIRGPRAVLVDTGSPWDRDVLLAALADHSLVPDDINYVVTTHGHPDHCGNLNLFTSAKHIHGFHVYHGDEYSAHDFAQGIPFEIDDDIEIISTPGHSDDDVTVIARNTNQGTVAVVGDLFEREEDLLIQPDLWKRNSRDRRMQALNRARVLDVADVIIPGHGPAFAVKPEYRKLGGDGTIQEVSP